MEKTPTPLEQRIDFLVEIDKLKEVIRQSPLISKLRRENSAEHSWHLALYALILADHAPPGVSIDRVIRMLLIHDLVEIDAGDVPVLGQHDAAQQAADEERAADRLFGMLPAEQGGPLKALWHEFEAKQTPDARFAKSLDRFQPLIHNVRTGGGTWTTFKPSYEKVTTLYGGAIGGGATELWDYARPLVNKYFGEAGEDDR